MANCEKILCIDIGGDSLKIAEFHYPNEGGIILDNFAFAEFGGNLKEEDLFEGLADALIDTIAENGFTAKKVHLSISGQNAFVRFVKLPPVGDEEERVKQIVEYEARQNVPFPMDEVVWDYQLISNEDSDSEIEVMFVVVKNELIEGFTNIVEKLGKQVILAEVAPASCYNAARASAIGEDECVVILNIGGRCSTLVFIDRGRFYVRTIPIAGNTITQQISKEFGIPFADAEEMKRRHGFVALGGAYEEPDSEVAATVSKIVRNVMTRLHGEINRSINVYRSQQKGQKPAKLYLAGGSSVMAFTPRFFSEKLRVPVEYFNPFQVVSLSPAIDKENLAEVAHMFSEVIGLGLRHATPCPIEISLIPDALKKQHELNKKLPYLYSSAVSLVLCLLVTFFGFSRLETINENKTAKAKIEVDKTSLLISKVDKANSKLKKIAKQYKSAKNILVKRDAWITILNELQTTLPDNMWLTSIKGEDKGKTKEAILEGGGGGPTGPPSSIDIFKSLRNNSRQMKTKSVSTDKEIAWIYVEGHYLLDKKATPLEENFKRNLLRSKIFTDEKSEILASDFTPASGDKNITTFQIEIKLKKTIAK